MTEWRETTLGAFSPLSYGANLPSATRQEGEVPVVSSAGVIDSHDEALVNCAGLVVGRKGTVGSITLVDKPFWPIDTTFFVADEPDKRDLRFAYYLLSSLGLDQMNSDSAVPGLNRENAHAVCFQCPPLPEQRAIAGVLGGLDDRIAANRRMAAALESMARAIFADWFVDFGPTRARMAGEAPYLAPDIWDMFPDRLDPETGLPEGWEMKPLGCLYDVSIGRTPPRKEQHHFCNSGVGVPWLSIKTMGSEDAYIFDTEETLTPAAVKQFKVLVVPEGTVLLSFKLTVGRVAIAGTDMSTNEAIAHIRPIVSEYTSPAFTYCLLKQFDFETLASTSSIATAINSQSIKSMFILAPPMDVVEAFNRIAGPLFEQLRAISLHSRSLARMRDLLLTPLMSGRLRVATAPHPPEDDDGKKVPKSG